MCGFAGFWSEAKTVKDTATAVAVLGDIRHRGPDDQGLVAFSLATGWAQALDPRTPTVTEPAEGWLGFNRLSIQDLSENGHQPMFSRDGKVIVMLNGEIYNVADLKAQLRQRGVTFRGHSDTEVILELYLAHGLEKMVGQLNGMFAVVIVDLRSGELFLIRDRFGIKPLYVVEHNGGVAFGSEIKGLLRLEGFAPRLRHAGLDEYLLFRNNIHQTLFEGVQSVVPGTYVRVAHGSRKITSTYFSIASMHRRPQAVADDKLVQQTGTFLRDSVRRQLISDVNVGCQLSGGVDSSLVTALAAEHQPGMQTISITFKDPAYNEEAYMDTVISSTGVTAHKHELSADYYVNVFQKATWHFEAPLNHPNTIGLYLLSEQARKHVTVLLSGEGADELFGGYGRFVRVADRWNPRAFYSYWRSHGFSLFPAYPYWDHGYRTILSSAYMTPALARAVMPEFDSRQALGERRAVYEALQGSPFNRHVQYELSTYLPDLLHRQDTMSMAHSIENRVPFLDHELVDWAFLLPEGMLRGNGRVQQTKWVIKQLAASRWGEPFAFRNKSGFSIPLRSFFKNPEFSSFVSDVLLPGMRQRGLFKTAVAERWWKRKDSITSHELDALWILLAFESWCQVYKISS